MIKNILLDCDGVLADFWEGAYKAHNRPYNVDEVKHWDFWETWGITAEEFWEPLRGEAFWDGLPKYPWSDKLYDELCELGRVVIVTSPSNCPYASTGKTKWLQRNFGVRPKDIFIGGNKDLMARPSNLLIDDYPVNIEKFKAEGGHTILFPQPWNGNDGDYLTVLDEAERMIYDN